MTRGNGGARSCGLKGILPMICRRRLVQWDVLMGAALGAGIASAEGSDDAVYAAVLDHIAREQQTEDMGRHLAFVL